MPMDVDAATRLAGLFKALADPTRVRIISVLHDGEACVHRIVDLLGLRQPAVSQQLRLLRNLRIVAHRKDGRHVFYRLADAHVRDLYERAREHVDHA